MLGKVFSFRGRLSRAEYWMRLGVFIGIDVLIFIILQLFGKAIGQNMSISGVAGLILAVVFFASLIIPISANVRRLHDLNRSRWWIALYIVGLFVLAALYKVNITTPDGTVTAYRPLGGGVLSNIDLALAIGLMIYIFVSQGFFKGAVGPNKYGPDANMSGPANPDLFGR